MVKKFVFAFLMILRMSSFVFAQTPPNTTCTIPLVKAKGVVYLQNGAQDQQIEITGPYVEPNTIYLIAGQARQITLFLSQPLPLNQLYMYVGVKYSSSLQAYTYTDPPSSGVISICSNQDAKTKSFTSAADTTLVALANTTKHPLAVRFYRDGNLVFPTKVLQPGVVPAFKFDDGQHLYQLISEDGLAINVFSLDFTRTNIQPIPFQEH